MLLLPILYVAVGVYVGMNFGAWWALASIFVLSFSFAASLQLLEAETSLLMSMLSILRVTRLSNEVEELRSLRAGLVEQVRELTERMANPDTPRMFTQEDFNNPDV